MRKILFIDRDGTILREPEDEQIDSYEKFHFVEGAIGALSFIRRHTDYELVMVSNQDGLGTASYPEKDFWPTQNLMLEILQGEGVTFDDILIDRSFPEDNLPTRKPGTGMLTDYIGNPEVDLAGSFVIGDRENDRKLAENLGCQYLFPDWKKVAEIVFAGDRKASVVRRTKETDITVELCLDGEGRADIQTGLGFFDHMLEQIAKHGNIDLMIRCKGDLHVDAVLASPGDGLVEELHFILVEVRPAVALHEDAVVERQPREVEAPVVQCLELPLHEMPVHARIWRETRRRATEHPQQVEAAPPIRRRPVLHIFICVQPACRRHRKGTPKEVLASQKAAKTNRIATSLNARAIMGGGDFCGCISCPFKGHLVSLQHNPIFLG